MYEKKKYFLNKLLNQLLMNSTESKIGLLIEDAHTVLERGVKRGAVKMAVQLNWLIFTEFWTKSIHYNKISGSIHDRYNNQWPIK